MASPNKSFAVFPAVFGLAKDGSMGLWKDAWGNANPFAKPYAAVVAFWNFELGPATNGIPSITEVIAGMSDPDPRRRWAARAYCEATSINYPMNELSAKCNTPEQTAWVHIASLYARLYGTGFNGVPSDTPLIPSKDEEAVRRIQDPCLALILSLEQARENRPVESLDQIVKNHRYSANELAGIKPELYQLGRTSETVRQKLIGLKLEAPEFSADVVRGLANTNMFTPIPNGQ